MYYHIASANRNARMFGARLLRTGRRLLIPGKIFDRLNRANDPAAYCHRSRVSTTSPPPLSSSLGGLACESTTRGLKCGFRRSAGDSHAGGPDGHYDCLADALSRKLGPNRRLIYGIADPGDKIEFQIARRLRERRTTGISHSYGTLD